MDGRHDARAPQPRSPGCGPRWGRMDGRSVLVTGATRGIGLETAVRLAGLGADVLVHGRDAAAERPPSRPYAPRPRPRRRRRCISPTSARSTASAVWRRSCRRERPRLDVLVANAGVYCPARRETRTGSS